MMTERDFQTKLAELLGEITTLPQAERQKLQDAALEARKTHERLQHAVSSLQESVDYLRLSIKYLVFDLEATRRENNLLRQLLAKTEGETESESDRFE
jgi:septal ring factor EnvC (AmiA/AmiB activator)